jgi:SAM-dependent methyltransferase
MKNFTKQLQPSLLNIEEKNRSNLFAWRGQFSPQLIEYLLDAYCVPGSVVLDPFAGSGTVLLEAALMSLPAYGFEINPAAWCFSKLYEFTNTQKEQRNEVVKELRDILNRLFPFVLFSDNQLDPNVTETKIANIANLISEHAKILCNALVVLLDAYNNPITSGLIQSKFQALADLVLELPFTVQPIKADLQDARALPLESESVDFVITSPPYINVFNYHQNYRRSVELLGWDTLRVAKSEIGSNRANRGNRFLTVLQYCVDMANTIQELSRVVKKSGRAVFVMGHESRVLGVPFYNADMLERIALESGLFDVVLRQQRLFLNRFGQNIREDILNLQRVPSAHRDVNTLLLGRTVARNAFESSMRIVPPKNSALLQDAIGRIELTEGTPIFDSSQYSHYQTRERVMMVKENGDQQMQKNGT